MTPEKIEQTLADLESEVADGPLGKARLRTLNNALHSAIIALNKVVARGEKLAAKLKGQSLDQRLFAGLGAMSLCFHAAYLAALVGQAEALLKENAAHGVA